MACITKVVTVEYIQHIMQTVGLLSGTWDGPGQGRAGLGGVLLIALHFTHLTQGGGTLTRMPIVGCQQLCQTKHGQSVSGREVHILNSHMEVTKCDGLELKVEHHQPCQMKKQIPTPDTRGGCSEHTGQICCFAAPEAAKHSKLFTPKRNSE